MSRCKSCLQSAAIGESLKSIHVSTVAQPHDGKAYILSVLCVLRGAPGEILLEGVQCCLVRCSNSQGRCQLGLFGLSTLNLCCVSVT